MKRKRDYGKGDDEDASVRSGEETSPDEGSSSGSAKEPSSSPGRQPSQSQFDRSSSFVMYGTGNPHPELGAGIVVGLRPLVTTDENGKISKVSINGRTPSPFGRAMGDHTVAWQLLVDEVHASLYGKSLSDAIKALRTAHEHASHWMKSPGTPGKLLLRELGDIAPRWQRLEDAAYHTAEHLNVATVSRKAAAQRSELALAIAYHLAYLNYLPFETVPASSARGSHGSAEGWYRSQIVTYESQHKAGSRGSSIEMETDAEESGDRKLRKALWALFDFAAAVRESHLEYVLRPSSGLIAMNTREALDELAERLLATAAELHATRTDKSAENELRDIASEAERFTKSGQYPDFIYAAGIIKELAATLNEALILSVFRRQAQAGRVLTDWDEWLDPAMGRVAETALNTERMTEIAPERAARILAAVLSRHLHAVATAYPNTVKDSGLLLPSPAQAAFDQLESWLRESEYADDAEENAEHLSEVKERFLAHFADVEIEPAIASGWVHGAGNPGMVVTWSDEDSEFKVNGRAPTPAGVSGMGCHTTAWVLQRQALNAIAGSGSGTAQLAALEKAVRQDLKGDVIALDELLPADQLEGGQLTDLFRAAAGVFSAGSLTEAAQSYLEFRNLLPFATVDEGDRGGDAERADATMEALYDKKAVEAAAETVTTALKDLDQVDRISVALSAAATQLMADATTKWPQPVQTAARASAKRLSARSNALAKKLIADTKKLTAEKKKLTAEKVDTADAVSAGIRITETRWAEHERVYGLVHP